RSAQRRAGRAARARALREVASYPSCTGQVDRCARLDAAPQAREPRRGGRLKEQRRAEPLAPSVDKRGIVRREEPPRDNAAALAADAAPPLVSAPSWLSPPAGEARVQRTSLPEAFATIATPAHSDAGGLLVDDDAPAVLRGQMRKGEFMSALR